jgi:NAD(P)-dependent dehydrogenase (short-subunit alcohol dehydrogenase family)
MRRRAYDLDGKVALVTGAARGIGFEVARSLNRRGAAVVLVDLDGDATAEAAATIGGDRAVGLAADVTDWDAIGAAVQSAVDRFGALDVCVANAGIAPQGSTARVMDPELFERVLDVNLYGVWRTVRSALPHIVARGGQAVLVSSIYAFTNGVLVSPYASSKAAVEQLGRALRVELALHRASASVVYFGFVETEMTRFEKGSFESRVEELIPGPLRRRISAEEAAEAVARGIERRAPRIVAPRWWIALSSLRGVVAPVFDAGLQYDSRFRELLREADTERRAVAEGATEPPEEG